MERRVLYVEPDVYEPDPWDLPPAVIPEPPLVVALPLGAKSSRTCRQCGAIFNREQRQSYECSTACTDAYYAGHYRKDFHCLQCGQAFRGRHTAAYCSGACRVAAHRAAHRSPLNGVRAGSPPKPPLVRLRFDVLERDCFRCRYCGRSADSGAVLHVDHVHPKAKGGEWSMNNLITACRECNLGKGDRILKHRDSTV